MRFTHITHVFSVIKTEMTMKEILICDLLLCRILPKMEANIEACRDFALL